MMSGNNIDINDNDYIDVSNNDDYNIDISNNDDIEFNTN